MEESLVSKHVLEASNYEGFEKWKGVVQGWAVFLVILIVTRIPAVQAAMLNFAAALKNVDWVTSGVKFLINGIWFIAIPLVIGTLLKLKEKRPFEEICIFNDGIGFVTMGGKLQKVDFDQVYLHYGEFQKSIFIECAVLKISAKAIPWEYFSQADVLHKNLQRYANWNLNKYRKL